MNNITVLENVYRAGRYHVPGCHDSLIPVKDISFENLDTIKIAGDTFLKTHCPEIDRLAPGDSLITWPNAPPKFKSRPDELLVEHEKNEEMVFQVDGREVRRVFTPKYKPIDQLDVVLELYGMGYWPETQVQCHLDVPLCFLSIMDGEKVLSSWRSFWSLCVHIEF